MKSSISIVQLPFPSLDYFPAPVYFRALERWYRSAVGSECTVPTYGLWEVPPWISWVKAALRSATRHLPHAFEVEVIDLSRVAFDEETVISSIAKCHRTDIYCFSPLTQNSILAQRVAAALRTAGCSVVAGGAIADHLDRECFTSIYRGRIETDIQRFCLWLSSILEVSPSALIFSPDTFAENIDYGWASRSYQTGTMYLRTFTNHGCPLACTFCADRLSGSTAVAPEMLESDLSALSSAFHSRSALYIGDLTFGISSRSIVSLQAALDSLRFKHGRAFNLIVQTNASLVTPRFAEQLRQLGVALVELGVESANAVAVQRTEKFRPSTGWLENKFRVLQDFGLHVAANVIVGLPQDDSQAYADTEAFILKWRDSVWFNVYGFVPYPGTPIYERLAVEERIHDWDVSRWCEGAPFVFRPYKMSADSAYDWLLKILGSAIR